MAALPPEYLDPNTPPDVVVTDLLRPRIDGPALGVPLGQRDTDVPAPPTDPLHRLVTVGDSLTHGLTSGAVSRTELSWPAILARCVDVPFQAPAYGGPLGGLPFNIEGFLRKLQERFGDRLNALEALPPPLADLDTRFYLSDRTGRLQGGLFGLDGVHPTTSGYGIVADELVTVLAAAGVAAKRVDFTALRREDTLNQDPPALMATVFDLATPFLARLVSRGQ